MWLARIRLRCFLISQLRAFFLEFVFLEVQGCHISIQHDCLQNDNIRSRPSTGSAWSIEYLTVISLLLKYLYGFTYCHYTSLLHLRWEGYNENAYLYTWNKLLLVALMCHARAHHHSTRGVPRHEEGLNFPGYSSFETGCEWLFWVECCCAPLYIIARRTPPAHFEVPRSSQHSEGYVLCPFQLIWCQALEFLIKRYFLNELQWVQSDVCFSLESPNPTRRINLKLTLKLSSKAIRRILGTWADWPWR